MKALNRTLLVLIAATGIALVWSLISRTAWAASVSVLGIGHDYDNAIQPLIKVAGAMVAMVAGTLLVQRTNRWLRTHLQPTAIRDKFLILVSGLKP